MDLAIPDGSKISRISLKEAQGDKYHLKVAHGLKLKVLYSTSKSVAEEKNKNKTAVSGLRLFNNNIAS